MLPRHVAMEMKADIANQPRQEQFHKIYIQRYENVRYVPLDHYKSFKSQDVAQNMLFIHYVFNQDFQP